MFNDVIIKGTKLRRVKYEEFSDAELGPEGLIWSYLTRIDGLQYGCCMDVGFSHKGVKCEFGGPSGCHLLSLPKPWYLPL